MGTVKTQFLLLLIIAILLGIPENTAFGSAMSGSFCKEDLLVPVSARKHYRIEKNEKYLPESMTCDERDRYAKRLNGVAIFFSSLTVISTCTPEPFLTKIHASIFALSSMVASTMSFFIKDVNCTPNSTRLTWSQEEQVIEMICRQLGKTFEKSTRPALHSNCGV